MLFTSASSPKWLVCFSKCCHCVIPRFFLPCQFCALSPSCWVSRGTFCWLQGWTPGVVVNQEDSRLSWSSCTPGSQNSESFACLFISLLSLPRPALLKWSAPSPFSSGKWGAIKIYTIFLCYLVYLHFSANVYYDNWFTVLFESSLTLNQ